MSLTGAMWTGVSGLLNNGEAMNVIGNNISNVNTVGFKQGRTLFSDMLSTNVGNGSQIGKGVQMQAVQNLFTQGPTQSSENVTDLAISGNSFFALKAPNVVAPVNQNAALLSRAGAFSLDNKMTLVNPDGYQVLDTSGNPIVFSNNAAAIAAKVTVLNTDAGTAKTNMATDIANAVTAGAPLAITNAATAANNLITAANATFLATPTAANAQALNNTVAAAYASVVTAAANGVPAVLPPALVSTPIAGTVVADNANLSTEQGKAFSKITSIDSTGLITYLGADGVSLNYYNASGAPGVTVSAANAATVQRLAVVTAQNPGALTKVGGSLYQSSGDAGVSAAGFSLGTNQANGAGESIQSNTLEGSNVDMASEFVKMITTQRAYSANSKTITTTDQMTQEVLGLIR